MNNQALPTTSTPQNIMAVTMAEYVHGAMEMETQKYTLEESIKKQREERDDFEKRIKREFKSAEEEYQITKNQYLEAKKRADTYTFRTYLKEWSYYRAIRDNRVMIFIGWLFAHYFCGAFITVPCVFIWQSLFAIFDAEGWGIAFGVVFGICLWFTIFFILRHIIRKSRYKRNHVELIVNERKLLQELEAQEKPFKIANNKYQENLKTIAKMDEQLDYLQKHLHEFERNIEKYYQKNIIPPDYRCLSCVVLIDYVFRNDQADTMREATLLCDTRIRHEIQIAALKELSETMRGIGVALNSIESSINAISYDMKTIAENQNTIIKETKASRYATEAVQSSAERLEWKMYTDLAAGR